MSLSDLLAALAEQDFGVFQGRRVDGGEAVGAIDPAGLFQQAFARNHQVRKIIAKAFERPRRDQVCHASLQFSVFSFRVFKSFLAEH